ncbi:MAG: alpha/beta hydrolase [Hahellaceae bacterium]|nr:alpha/beta hydrolase [Hahellaceae bacterium]
MVRSLLLILTVTIQLFLAGCSDFKHKFTDMALKSERDRAGLAYKSVEVDSMNIVYLESNSNASAETMVLIHGFGANKDNWVRMAAQFEDEYHVVIIDLPGHGDSSKDLQRHYSYNDQVDYLHDILSKLNIKRFHLAGNSMGGAISTLYTAAYPEQVATLTLFDPAGVFQFESELAQYLAKNENPLIVKNSQDFTRLMDFALEEKPFIPWPVTDILAEKAMANQQINAKVWEDIRTLDPQMFLGVLLKITTPTLIIWGIEDKVINYKNAEIFKQNIPNAKLELLEHIGHAPMIEVPETSANLMRTFIKS